MLFPLLMDGVMTVELLHQEVMLVVAAVVLVLLVLMVDRWMPVLVVMELDLLFLDLLCIMVLVVAAVDSLMVLTPVKDWVVNMVVDLVEVINPMNIQVKEAPVAVAGVVTVVTPIVMVDQELLSLLTLTAK